MKSTALFHAFWDKNKNDSDNNKECVKLFLAHPQCTREIVRMRNKADKHAKDEAESQGYKECVALIRDFLSANPATSSSSNKTSVEPGKLTLAELAQAIEGLKVEEETFLKETTKEIDSLKQKQEAGLAEMKSKKEALKAEILRRSQED